MAYGLRCSGIPARVIHDGDSGASTTVVEVAHVARTYLLNVHENLVMPE